MENSSNSISHNSIPSTMEKEEKNMDPNVINNEMDKSTEVSEKEDTAAENVNKSEDKPIENDIQQKKKKKDKYP